MDETPGITILVKHLKDVYYHAIIQTKETVSGELSIPIEILILF